MIRNHAFTVIAIVLMMASLACSASLDLFGNKEPTPTATVLEEPTPEPPTPDVAKLTAQVASSATQAALSAEMTQAVVNFIATETQAFSQASTPASTEPGRPAAGPPQKFMDVLQDLKEGGAILTTDGEYHRLTDFERAMANLGSIYYDDTDFSPKSFVISADVEWSSASETSNWPEAGCGFVFGGQDSENFSMGSLCLDGYAYIDVLRDGEWDTLTQRKVEGGVEIPNGGAWLTMVVTGSTVYFYVDGNQTASANITSAKPGFLSLAVLSGTNKDYGTRCTMKNIDLMIFE